MEPGTARHRPRFDDLPLHPGDPPGSAWGLWGPDDELGTLNLLDGGTVRAAVAEVVTGERIPVSLPLNGLVRPMNPVRKPCEHRIIAKAQANDDEVGIAVFFYLLCSLQLHINTQGASHWDGLRHYPYQTTRQYYNGATQDDISGPSPTTRIGIQNMAAATITGRGVLVDWHAWKAAQDPAPPPPDPFSSHGIPLDEILAAAAAQNGLAFRAGDILLVRTGWMAAYRGLSRAEQAALPQRARRTSIGLAASEAALRWHWETGFAAVASDTVAYEAWPSPRGWRGTCLHEVFLSGWGLPVGESFDLEALAARCRALGKWSFLFVSVPLHVPGGVASPPNAVAIL